MSCVWLLMGNYQYSIHIDGQEFLIIFFIPIYEGICSVLCISHNIYNNVRTSINTSRHHHHHQPILLFSVGFFSFVPFIHSQSIPSSVVPYIVHAFIISDLPTICTCHNNLRLTYRIVKETFLSKIFFTIIYTAFSLCC